MNKKKIIRSVLLLIVLSAIVYFFILPNIDKSAIAPKASEVKTNFIPPPSEPPLSLSTDKASYESGEPLKISILATPSKNIPAFDKCKITIKRNESRSSKENNPAGLSEKFVLNESSPKCKEYKSGFSFSLDEANSKTLSWDQNSCENGNVPEQAIPDDYSIVVFCSVKNADRFSGLGSFSDGTNVTISEPASCKDKKMEIANVKYDSQDLLSVKIKNIGSLDIENVKIFLDDCASGKKVKTEKEIGKISKDSFVSKNIVIPGDCRYLELKAHIGDCYDMNASSWETFSITNP